MKYLKAQALVICFLAFISGCTNNKKEDKREGAIAVDTNAGRMSTDTSTPHERDSITENLIALKNQQGDFLTGTYSNGMMEIELGKWAQQNASSRAVKDYGRMLEKDHSKANAEVKKIAEELLIELPQTMKEEHAMHIKELEALKGANFDKAYIMMMVDGHTKNVDKYKAAATNKEFTEHVKSFASRTLPTLEKHLAKAKEIEANL